MPARTHYDAVIVGAGHNGLVAAAYLARAGLSVLVLERSDTLGGATASAPLFPGMDARISRYAYLLSLFPQTILRELELPFSSRRRAIASCTPYDEQGVPAALLLSNTDDAVSAASLHAAAGDADRRGFEALLECERTFAALVWPSLLEPLRSRRTWESGLQLPEQRRAWEAFVERPLGEALERAVHSDLLRGLLLTDGKIGIFTHAHDPSLLQNRCFILHTIGNGIGEWQVPVGGMGALAESLTIAARRAGAEIMAGAPVEAIHRGTSRHTVVFRRHDTEQSVEATRVLISAGPQVFAQLLGEPYLPAIADEGSVCKVNMLLRRLPRLQAPHVDTHAAFTGTLHVDEGYANMQVSYEQAAIDRLPERPPFELYCHTLTDPSILGRELRAAGYHTLTLFGLDAPYRLFEHDNGAVAAELLRRYLAGLNRILRDPIEDCLADDARGQPCVEIKTPVDLERELTLNRGNIFHGALSWFFAEREDDAGLWGVETPYERVYRCGASAIRGGAVSGIPGRNAAQCIFAELSMAPL